MDNIEAADFARAFLKFCESMHHLAPTQREPVNELLDRAKKHLGIDPVGLPSFKEKFDPSEHQAIILAFQAMQSGTPWEILGLAEFQNYSHFSLTGLLRGRFGGADISAPEYANLPISAEATLPCVLTSMHLARYQDKPLLVLLHVGDDNSSRGGLAVEVVAADAETVQGFLSELKVKTHEVDIYRGRLLAYHFSEYGHQTLTFARFPRVTRDDIILPEAILESLERHSLGVTARVDALRASGQHLKRGILLYGPPGTGKTYSVMYVCNCMPNRTTVLLNAPSSGALGRAVAIARAMQPATVVIEDVDLVAMERTSSGQGTNPLLFHLLNEMDGLSEDADILFILTTNRVDLLESALASRPGRVDQAIEIGLPDLEGRRRLLQLFLRNVPHQVNDLETTARNSEGTSAAFIKELVRRAVLMATPEGVCAGTVTEEHLSKALTDLLEHSAPILRSILGAAPAGELDLNP